MRKILIVIFAFILASPAQASVLADFTLTDVPAATWYIGQWDKLALDFVIPSNQGQVDTLNAITVKNQGTAYYGVGLKYLRLWSDSGVSGFQGWGTDNDHGTGTYRGPQDGWYWDGLNLDVGPDGRRFFVTVETWPTIPTATANYSVQLAVHGFMDQNKNGAFDVDDFGIFMKSGNNGPTNDVLSNSTSQTISYANSDYEGPVVIFDNIYNNLVLNSSTNLIQGRAKDQGNSSPESVSISITKPGEPLVWKPVESVGDNFTTWKYKWENVKEGLYNVQTKASDFQGHQSVSGAVSVQVVLGGDLSQTYSSVTTDKTTGVFGGEDKVTFNVTVRNEDDYPIKGRTVYLKEVRSSGSVVIASTGTGSVGKAMFKVGAAEIGTYKFSVTLDNEQIGDVITLNFVAPSPEPVINYEVGRWVKRADMTAVYFLDANNVRHAYPVQAVWESYFGSNFSKVETIDPETMATYSLGKNVPFKTNSLIKLPTIPKVYKVEGQTLHWLTTEEVAKKYFGNDWATQIKAIPDSFFSDYVVGESLGS